ncbi:MAG: hypothetical protein R6X02_12905, partial [Enhygromyxa sp.]
ALSCTLLCAAACCPRGAATVEPKDPVDTSRVITDWVPDEPLEVAKTHEVEAPEVDPHADLSEDERMEKARVLFEEAEAAWAAEQWAEAEAKYEEAYHLVPGKHGFAFKVAMAAIKADDCEKALAFLEHFIIYGDIDRQKELIIEAKHAHRELECWR